jgi:hypothetical protein
MRNYFRLFCTVLITCFEVDNMDIIPNFCHDGHKKPYLGDDCENGVAFNHYSTKSKDEYFNVKARRGSRGSSILKKKAHKYFKLRNLNDIGGFKALKYLRAIRESFEETQVSVS